MDGVARRCGASKATIYRRWPGKTALVVAAAAALFRAPELPDTGDLRADLLACGQAYLMHDSRSAQVMASVLSAARHDTELRASAQQALGDPYRGLFEGVLGRAADRGLIEGDLDLDIVSEVFPAMAYHWITGPARVVSEDNVRRVVDAVLLPALGVSPG